MIEIHYRVIKKLKSKKKKNKENEKKEDNPKQVC